MTSFSGQRGKAWRQMSQPFSPLKAWAEDKGDFHSLRGDQGALQMCTEALSTEYTFSSHAELHRSSVISGLHTEIPLLHSWSKALQSLEGDTSH